LPATPRKAVAPQARPSQMATGSIPRPEKPVGKNPAKASSLFTTSRVHLRAKASTSAAIVSTLKPGQKVGVLARDGKWRLVSVAGQKGWIHGDYLGAQSTAPKAAVAEGPRPALPVQSRPAGSRPWGSLLGGRHPARAPQGGNCQCPFDLMLNGKQCGEHSAYTRQGERGVECYL
jgi:Bacterial SH3 domain